jgi:hypothetical protein
MEIDEIISWDVNRELVENYGERKRKMWFIKIWKWIIW